MLLEVATFDDLCDLIILEQFKNMLPGRIATHINEKKVTTAAEAVVSADVLLHKSSFRERTAACDSGWRGTSSGVASFNQTQPGKAGSFKFDHKSWGTLDKSKSCNY